MCYITWVPPPCYIWSFYSTQQFRVLLLSLSYYEALKLLIIAVILKTSRFQRKDNFVNLFIEVRPDNILGILWAFVITMVSDALVPNRHQAIWNHHADLAVTLCKCQELCTKVFIANLLHFCWSAWWKSGQSCHESPCLNHSHKYLFTTSCVQRQTLWMNLMGDAGMCLSTDINRKRYIQRKYWIITRRHWTFDSIFMA